MEVPVADAYPFVSYKLIEIKFILQNAFSFDL